MMPSFAWLRPLWQSLVTAEEDFVPIESNLAFPQSLGENFFANPFAKAVVQRFG